MDRKSFLQKAGRVSLLSIMAAMVFILFRNRQISSSAACSENEFCRNCRKYGSCSLPQAIEQEEYEKG